MENQNFSDVKVMWKPDERYGRVMKTFKKYVQDRYSIQIGDYWDFHKWSIENIPEFWAAMWDFSGIVYSKKYEKVIDLNRPMGDPPEWFVGARVNYAENLLKHRDDGIALILAGEDRETEKVTFAQMFQKAELYAASFRKSGLKKGDIVVCQMSNREEAVLAMLAVTSIGAIWAGALPFLGPKAVLNRFSQIKPKVYITIDRFQHDRKEIEMLQKIKEIVDNLPSLETVIIVASKKDSHLKDISAIRNSCFLDDFLQLGRNEDGTIPPMLFEQVSFSHPVFINYTSGTTGLPKALYHGAGILLSAARDYYVHLDCTKGSVSFSMSPVGWVTWNACCNILAMRTTLSLFEGEPFLISPTYFWDLLEELKITDIMISTGMLDEFVKRGYVTTEKHPLKSLRTFMAGGSVVKPQNYDFMYEKVKKDLPFASTFGSTEFLGTALMLETSIPVHRGEIPALSFGSDIRVINEAGEELHGELGELAVFQPMPNMPLGIWGDRDGSMYKEKYFAKYPGKFAMGDCAVINPVTKGIVIRCRSDETLKQRGCRFGSSEIYNVVETFPAIRDSLCVSKYNKQMDEQAVLFLKIREGHVFNEELVSRIRQAITQELTARHVPDIIIETKDIPYNINNKKTELIVKKIINNQPYNAETVRNPESLKNFLDIPELQGI